jgi:GTP pyrophosphokinase
MANGITIDGIIKKAKSYLPTLNEDRIKFAYDFANTAHKGTVRQSGEPYIKHPLEVTNILLSLKPDEDSIIAGLLHDVLEDTPTELDEVKKSFGDSIIPLLKGLEKLSKVHYRGEERQVENLRKMFLAMAKDIRVILIKLADRLHNMRTLQHLPTEDKRKRIAQETLNIYSPIASRLGIYKIKNELDTLCFKHLYPKEFERLTKELDDMIGKQNNTIKNSKSILQKALKQAGIKAEIEGRIKNPYSIYKKLKKKDKNYVSELYDIFALRIIVENEAQCYQVLGLVHKNWTPLSRRFKDYIAVPKTNGYQSLHTTLIGLCPKLNNQPIEVQLRTKEMNEVAEYGIAAHWHYEERHGAITIDQEKLSWVQSLVDLHETLKSNSEFIESLSVDIFHDRIFILTPKGDVLDLPYDATPVDFAYGIHTGVGHRCKGAKVNGRIVPLDYKLKNGQVVDVITGNTEQPNRYWLSFIVTSSAKSRIKQWFNTQDRDKILKMGKDLINKKLKQFGKPILDPNLSIFKVYEGSKLSIRERENVVERVGNGSLAPLDVIKKVVQIEQVMKESSKETLAKEVLAENVNFEEKKPEILITGEKGHKTQIASCCMPTPDDSIIGYITRGKGVTIHKQNCKVLNGLDDSRLIRTSWSTKKLPKYTVKLKIERRSRLGLLRDVADVFVQNQLPIMDIENVRETGSDQGHFLITASLDSFDTLNKLIRELENVDGVFSVKEID